MDKNIWFGKRQSFSLTDQTWPRWSSRTPETLRSWARDWCKDGDGDEDEEEGDGEEDGDDGVLGVGGVVAARLDYVLVVVSHSLV